MDATNRKAFGISVVLIGALWVTFNLGKPKAAGHRLFDSQKPDAVQNLEDKRFDSKK